MFVAGLAYGFVVYLGGLLQLPGWLQDLSPNTRQLPLRLRPFTTRDAARQLATTLPFSPRSGT